MRFRITTTTPHLYSSSNISLPQAPAVGFFDPRASKTILGSQAFCVAVQSNLMKASNRVHLWPLNIYSSSCCSAEVIQATRIHVSRIDFDPATRSLSLCWYRYCISRTSPLFISTQAAVKPWRVPVDWKRDRMLLQLLCSLEYLLSLLRLSSMQLKNTTFLGEKAVSSHVHLHQIEIESLGSMPVLWAMRWADEYSDNGQALSHPSHLTSSFADDSRGQRDSDSNRLSLERVCSGPRAQKAPPSARRPFLRVWRPEFREECCISNLFLEEDSLCLRLPQSFGDLVFWAVLVVSMINLSALLRLLLLRWIG